jgi:hypothetical protein
VSQDLLGVFIGASLRSSIENCANVWVRVIQNTLYRVHVNYRIPVCRGSERKEFAVVTGESFTWLRKYCDVIGCMERRCVYLYS